MREGSARKPSSAAGPIRITPNFLATPSAADRAQAGLLRLGAGQGKDLPRLAMAHGIAYVATATVADLHDLEAKVDRAMELHGARYLHILVPCPLGWGSPPCDTILMARLAHETGLFPVFEAEYGVVTAVSSIRRYTPVESYLSMQGRYAHLFGEGGRAVLFFNRIIDILN